MENCEIYFLSFGKLREKFSKNICVKHIIQNYLNPFSVVKYKIEGMKKKFVLVYGYFTVFAYVSLVRL